MHSFDAKKEFARKGGPGEPEITQTVSPLINRQIDNYTAYPVIVEGVCTHVIMLCNKKVDKGPFSNENDNLQLSFDEHKLVYFIIHAI